MIIIDTREIFDIALMEEKKQAIVNQEVALVNAGTDIVLMADNRPDVVCETKIYGREAGISERTVSKMVSAVLADITTNIVTITNLKRLIVAGGDTAGTICRRLGIRGIFVL